MATSRAFDLALFVDVPANVNDASVVKAAGPPFTTGFKPVALSGKPGGVVVGADVPAASAQNQILISGPGPGFNWILGVNPAAAASVPPATARNNILIANASLQWAEGTPDTIVALGNAVTTTAGGTFVPAAKLVFTPTASVSVRLDGGDPALSAIDNFGLDMGTF